MGVRVRFHKGAWWAFVAFHNCRRSKKIGDRQSADRIAQRMRERLAAGELQLHDSSSQESFEEYARAWLKGVHGNLKAITIRFYTENLERHLLPTLGSRPTGSICRADCRQAVAAARAKNLRLNTVKGIARTLSSVLSQAVEDEKLPANPALRMGRYLRRGDEPKPMNQVLTREEAACWSRRPNASSLGDTRGFCSRFELVSGLANRSRCNGGISTGTAALSSCSGTSSRGVVTSPKSHQRRRVDLSSQLLSTLLQWKRHQQARCLEEAKPLPPWVFPSLEGTPLEERNVRHVFTRMLAKAGLRRIRIHDLRHTFASLLLQHGESVV